MTANNSLERQKNSLETMSQRYSQAETLEKGLMLMAQIFSKELIPEEVTAWKVALSKQPAPAIEWAFKDYLEAGQYFPRPAEISERIQQWHRERKALETDRLMEDCRQTRERLQAEGLPNGEEQIAEVWKMANAIAKKFPEPEPNRRNELQQKLDAAITKRREAKLQSSSTGK